MWKPRLIRPLCTFLLLFPAFQAFCRQPSCDVYAHPAPAAQDLSVCALVQRGFQLISKDRAKPAEELFRIALARATQVNDHLLEAHSHRGLSYALFLESKYPASKAEAETALRMFVDLEDARAIALMHDDLGLIATQNGDLKLASALLNQAYGEFEALGDDKGRLHALLDQIHEGGPEAEVAPLIARANSLAGALNDDFARGQIERARGDYAFSDGNYASALTSYQLALPLLKRSGERRQRAYVLTSLGRLYRELNDPPRARECYRAALHLQVGCGDVLGEMQTTNAIAVSYGAQKNWTEATRYYREALVLARRTASPRVIRFALGNLGGEYASSGQPARAIPILRKVAAEEKSSYIAAYRYQSLSKAYYTLGQYESALDAVNEAVLLRRQKTNESNLVDSLTQRALVLSSLGKTESGLADTVEALGILEKIRAHLVPNDFLKQGFGDAEQDIYDVAIQLRFSQRDFRSAADAMEAGRSRAFLDLLATRESATDSKAPATAANAPSAIPLAAISTDSTVYNQAFSADNIADLARTLPSTIISYWTTRDALYIVVVNPAGEFSGARVKVEREKLRRMIALSPGASGRLGFVLAEKSPAGPDIWQRLYDLLIDPIAPFLPSKQGAILTIIPHGPLFRLPFCALRDRSGQYLVERYATYYLPAASVARFTEQNEREALEKRNPFLLVSYGGPRGVSGPSVTRQVAGGPPTALAWANDEVGAIGSLLKSQRGEVLTSAQASVAAVTAAMQHSTLIHIASHGEFDENHPLASFLQLAPDANGPSATFRQGRLTAAEILNLHVPADLVVLSACRTSAGKISGDGVLGMTRAFFAAGTASVVATQWAIADKPSDWLMSRFYRNILNGMTKAEALRSAQLGLIADLRKGRVAIKTPLGSLLIPETPWFWAGFVLEGNP